jgi:hypothetical protein
VVLSTLTYPFSNAGLKEEGNPAFVLNVVALTGQPGGRIWFDEWHHGLRETAVAEISGPGQWLRQTAAGRSLLYTTLVLFLALALAGWRFGRPVPLPQERQRRAPLEHVTAVANLKRRAGHRQATLATYHRQLKRALGQRYGLSPTMPDETYVAALAQYRPELDQEALLWLLRRLHEPKIGEAEMVRLVKAVDEWIEDS